MLLARARCLRVQLLLLKEEAKRLVKHLKFNPGFSCARKDKGIISARQKQQMIQTYETRKAVYQQLP